MGMAAIPTNWRAQVLTLYPDMFPGPLGQSLAGKALDGRIWSLDVVDMRDYGIDRHGAVDDTPFGGGPGMVLRADAVAAAIDASANPEGEDRPLYYLSPRGRLIDQAFVEELAGQPGARLLCGRFEGLDERLLEARHAIEISLGDFVLSGGEPAAIALIDAVVRLLPGVIGAPQGLAEESFAHGLLEYPQYTRPQVWEGQPVPEILLSGHHARIAEWRRAQSERITEERRPDLWRRYLVQQGKEKVDR
jgi:tRNA (guanine37-N1)-methyltransferase